MTEVEEFGKILCFMKHFSQGQVFHGTDIMRFCSQNRCPQKEGGSSNVCRL